jgi:hypothetical protein
MEKEERKPLSELVLIPIGDDSTLHVTINSGALIDDTKGLKHGPCDVCMDHETFERAYWKLYPFISRYVNRLFDRIHTMVSNYSLKWVGFFTTVEGVPTIYINPFDLVYELERKGVPSEEIASLVKSSILKVYKHERQHADQDYSPAIKIKWADKDLKLASRLEIAFTDLGGVILNFMWVYVLVHSNLNVPIVVTSIVIPLITTETLVHVRDQLYDKFVQKDKPDEIKADLAESCPIAHTVFSFELSSFKSP